MVRVLSLRLRESDNATIADLHEKNRELAQAYADLKAAQAQIIEKEKLEQELRTAHWIQQSILPRELPRLPGFDFGAVMDAGQERWRRPLRFHPSRQGPDGHRGRRCLGQGGARRHLHGADAQPVARGSDTGCFASPRA